MECIYKWLKTEGRTREWRASSTPYIEKYAVYLPQSLQNSPSHLTTGCIEHIQVTDAGTKEHSSQRK